MFTFDAIEKSLYNGASPDRVPDAIKNRFSMVFGYDSLDNRFHVEISKRQIQFFYYDHDYEEWKPDEVKDEDYYKEVGFISLTKPKDTGNDILAFPQNIQDLDLYDECMWGLFLSFQKCIDCLGKDFYSFPFVDDYERDKSPKNNSIENDGKQCSKSCRFTKIGIFRCFMRCCLLNFVYEFENRWQSFGASPEYDNIRDKLRESDVYKLLSAKIYYTQYLYKDKFVPRNQEKYTYYAQKYADRLMDKNFNKVVPPECFWGKEEERQGWFYNPEEELERILDKNRHQQKEPDAATLKKSLVSKIRSFMYSRHAIGKAKTNCWSKAFFVIAQVMMISGNFIIVASALGFKEDCWTWYYDHFWIMFAWSLAVLVLIGISGCENRNCANALLPRILVAEAAAWLTIGIAEDLVKSLLWIDNNLLFYFMIVLAIVGLLIYGESKQHSPYLRWNYYLGKTFLIMNHSLFFSLSFGCLMQFFFYNSLLENSDALSSVVYKNHFGQVDKYLQQLVSLDNSINDYLQFSREYEFRNAGYNETNKNRNVIEGVIHFKDRDTASISIDNVVTLNTSLIPSFGDNIVDYHQQLLQNINSNVDSLNYNINSCKSKIKKKYGIDGLRNEFGLRIEKCEMKDMVDKTDIESIKSNLNWIWLVWQELKNEMQEARNNLMNDDYETLIKWSTYDGRKVLLSPKGCIEHLALQAQEKKCCRLIKEDETMNKLINIDGRRFFPNLLLLHTLIVLVLAFITQLIISEKSVTEPL